VFKFAGLRTGSGGPAIQAGGGRGKHQDAYADFTKYPQCCGFGSGIRCLFDLGIRDGEKIMIRIRDEQPGSYFRELRNNFWVKILKFFGADPRQKKFGSGMEKIRMRDKHPRSATLEFPDPTFLVRLIRIRLLFFPQQRNTGKMFQSQLNGVSLQRG
jgi:hypothetical protein